MLKLTYLENSLKCLKLVPMLSPNEGALPREGLIQHYAKAPPVYRFSVPAAAHYLRRQIFCGATKRVRHPHPSIVHLGNSEIGQL
jgi:hypothetical protein